MGAFFAGIFAKGTVGAFLTNLGLFAAGLASLALTIKWLLPAAPVLTLCLVILFVASALVAFTVDRLKARQHKRDMALALVQAQQAQSQSKVNGE